MTPITNNIIILMVFLNKRLFSKTHVDVREAMRYTMQLICNIAAEIVLQSAEALRFGIGTVLVCYQENSYWANISI